MSGDNIPMIVILKILFLIYCNELYLPSQAIMLNDLETACHGDGDDQILAILSKTEMPTTAAAGGSTKHSPALDNKFYNILSIPHHLFNRYITDIINQICFVNHLNNLRL